ncbi:MAG: hypothetical protein QUS33_10500 [Dehalococcoidia bacterium]|nr:hypothetical protein [Dehalococcoidia bacterium]
MRLCVKKIYCRHCKRAVRGQEQLQNGLLRIVCSRCGRSICTSNGIYWLWTQDTEEPPAPPPREAPASIPEEKPKRATRAKKQAGAAAAPSDTKEKAS